MLTFLANRFRIKHRNPKHNSAAVYGHFTGARRNPGEAEGNITIFWFAHGGAQCGFCSPGFIVSAKALLDENVKPTREDVRDWFQQHKNVCRNNFV